MWFQKRNPQISISRDVVSQLAKYGYKASDGWNWKFQSGVTMFDLYVEGHKEVDGHRYYDVACRLLFTPMGMLGSTCPLEWRASKRLADLREGLYNVAIEDLGSTPFKDIPFALRGRPPGTTARLDIWCKALASSINHRECSPHLVQSVLEFLEAPAPPESAFENGLTSTHLLACDSEDIPLISEEAVDRDKGVSLKLFLSKDLGVAPDEITIVVASIQTPSNVNETRQPSDLVCVLDISFSMGSEATIQSAGGATESHGLSLLDVAKHGVRTIIKTLSELDRVAIISFNQNSDVVFPLTTMDDMGKAKAEEALDMLSAMGGTNIWSGLKRGLDALRERIDKNGRFGHVMLLTDGESMDREQIKPNLLQYKGIYEGLPGTINTFGFGYNLDSALLVDLAEAGSGSYSFIPDAGFVGTAFVNTMSNLLVTMAREVYLTLSVEGDARIIDNTVLGGHPTEALSDCVRVNLGTLQYGQTKDVVLQMMIPEAAKEFLVAQVQYETRCGHLEIAPRAEANGEATQIETEVHLVNVEIQRCRCLFVDVLPQIVEIARKQSCDDALLLLNDAISNVRNTIATECVVVQALLEDMQGQSTEAISKVEWFTKWGCHYLPSIMFAHRLQQCNNFKDPGVQFYGGNLYSEIRDIADDVFNQLPAPKPSIRRRSVAAPTTMAAYNDRYAG